MSKARLRCNVQQGTIGPKLNNIVDAETNFEKNLIVMLPDKGGITADRARGG